MTRDEIIYHRRIGYHYRRRNHGDVMRGRRSAATGFSVLVLVALDDLGDRLSDVLTDGASPHRCPGLQAGVQLPWELHVEGDLVHGGDRSDSPAATSSFASFAADVANDAYCRARNPSSGDDECRETHRVRGSNDDWRILAWELFDADEAHRQQPSRANTGRLARARLALQEALQRPPAQPARRVGDDRIGNSGP